jgi:NADP-dependent 3-hydroxy acid dehydrogenase YdfG/acyl carrier protein
VEALLQSGPPVARSASQAEQVIWQRCPQEIPVDAFFQAQAARQIDLGPSYRWIEAIRRGERETVCRLRVPETRGGLDPELLHPGLLDACFGLLLATEVLAQGDTWLPFGIEEVRVHRKPDPVHCWAHLVLRQTKNLNRLVADVRLYDRQGQAMIEFIGLEARPASRGAILRQLPTAGGMIYHKEWRASAAASFDPPADAPVAWLIFADRLGAARHLAQQLRGHGSRCVLVTQGQVYGASDHDTYCINPADPADFARLLRESVGVRETPLGVVHLWSLDEAGPEQQGWLSQPQSLACGSVLHLVQALANAGSTDAARLWLVSRGGQPVGADPSDLQIQQMPLWGLGQVVALEHPELRCTCVDLDPAAAAGDGTALLETIQASDGETEIAWRKGRRYVTRLLQHPEPMAGGTPPVRADSSYMITGGTGGLGLSVAGWLAARGARHLILVSRGPAPRAAAEAIQSIEQAGTEVRIVRADVSDRVAMTAVFDMVRSSLPALRGVIHCAGIIEDGMLVEQGWERFRSVFPAKLAGAWHLHEFTQGLDLDYFVLFSSAASLLGNQGQGNYAAANAFLDGLAHYRRSKGLVGTSINWGPWDKVGIAVSGAAIQNHMSRQGFLGLNPDDGLALFEKILAGNVTQLGVINWNWRTYLAQFSKPSRLFAELIRTSNAPPTETRSAAATELLQRLKQASPEDRTAILGRFVQDTARRILGVHQGASLDPTQPLTEQGLDSLMAVEMRQAIANGLQRSFPVSLAFNYPTLNELAAYLETRLGEFFTPVEPPAARARLQDPDAPRGASSVRAAEEFLADIAELLDEEA